MTSDVRSEVRSYQTIKDAVLPILGRNVPVFGPESTEYTDAMLKMKAALDTSDKWQAQDQQWVDAGRTQA